MTSSVNALGGNSNPPKSIDKEEKLMSDYELIIVFLTVLLVIAAWTGKNNRH